MAYDQGLAERLIDCVGDDRRLVEMRMFGGFGYMLNGNMCLGIHKDYLIVRVGVETAAYILKEPGVSPMDITGKAMKGWAKIDPGGVAEDETLKFYCDCAIEFVSTLPAK